MFSFQNPAAFLVLLLIPLLYILRHLKFFKRNTFKVVLSDWEGKAFEWKGKFRKFLSYLSKAMLLAGFVLGVISLADPVISKQEKVYTNIGSDIIFVIDTSPSMAARDVDSGTRLNAAKNAIKSIIKNHDGFRYGIVTLGSNASILVPPTNDFSTFEKRMEEIQIGLLGNGSAIGDGISTAVCHLYSSSAPKKAIILLTDGENNAGEIHPETAAGLAKRNKIPLYIIGLGSKGTVPIEYTDPVSGKLYSGYLDSNFDASSLRKLSESAGGRYFESRTIQELINTMEEVAKSQDISQTFTYRTEKKHFYKNFILAALILLFITWILKRIILKEKTNFHKKKQLFIRSILIAFSTAMMLLAYLDFSWGLELVPVQKNGSAISFVFDISNSMTVDDGPEDITRLESAKIFSKKLLEHLRGSTVSLVIAKGDGVTAIPLTEDFSMIESLIDILSPNLMTVPGTSIGKGILKAKETFPKNFSSAPKIWVFTDGEETEGQLINAFSECIKSGISVTIVGFGSEEASNLVTGDGKSVVQTALRRVEVLEAIDTAQKKVPFYNKQDILHFVDSSERGAALKLLSQISDKDTGTIAYEAKEVSQYKLFLVLALAGIILSFIITELNYSRFLTASAGLIILSLTGCSNSSNILSGTLQFKQNHYKKAIYYFLKVAEKSEDPTIKAFALYDLGTAYQQTGEFEAAMQQFEKIPQSAPDSVKYAAFYNSGIIAQKQSDYEEAKKYFKKALEIDNTRIEAKINMELAMEMAQGVVKQNQSSTTQVQEEKEELPDLDKALFKHIRENDQKQWKNSESQQNQNLANDY